VWLRWRVGRNLDLARYWHRHGDLDEASRHASRAMALAAGPVPVTTRATAVMTAAAIDRDRDDLASSHAHLVRAVALLEAAGPGRHLAGALTDLGDVHRRLGRYEEATATLHRARSMVEAADARLLTVLGITAKEIGDFDEAARCYAGVAPLVSSMDERATLAHNLAGLAYARERYPEAEAHARTAVATRPRTRSVALAADLGVLGAAIAAQHRPGEARTHLERAVTLCEAARPSRPYELAVLLHNLAAVDHGAGQADDAERGYRRVLALKEDLLGTDHPEVGVVCNNLGTLLHDQGRTAEARRRYERARTIAERVYPAGHPTVNAIRHNLRRLTAGDGAI